MKYFKYIFLVVGLTSFTGPSKEKQDYKKGYASFYSDRFNGRKTASGAIFSNKKYTAASNYFPMGQMIRVTSIKTNKTIVVLVNDRMGHPTRLIDLTKEAAKQLQPLKDGVFIVKVSPAAITDTLGLVLNKENSL